MTRNGRSRSRPRLRPADRRGRPRGAAPGPGAARSRAAAGTRPRPPAAPRSGPRAGAPAWSATARNDASGARPISSDSASSTPSSAATSRTVSQTSHSGVTSKSRRFIETWAPAQLLDPEAVGLDLGQPAAGLADAAGDPLRELDVLRGEVDVVGDEERPGADGDGAGRRVHPRGPEVRLAAVLVDLGLEALVLAAPDVGELDPVRARARRSRRGRPAGRSASRSAPRTPGRARRSRPSSCRRAARTG